MKRTAPRKRLAHDDNVATQTRERGVRAIDGSTLLPALEAGDLATAFQTLPIDDRDDGQMSSQPGTHINDRIIRGKTRRFRRDDLPLRLANSWTAPLGGRVRWGLPSA